MKSQMTGKERPEAALKLEEVDRIPWAPKVLIGHYRSGTSSAQREMSIAEFADVLNCDAIAWNVLVKTHQENTSSTLVSPDLYGKYCLPLKKKACEMITGAGKHFMLHMCGCLRDLLPQILEVGADSWESFTPPPIGDTLFKDGREVSPDEVCLIGGMNAATVSVWDHGKVLDYVDETLDSLTHTRGIVFTSGGAMPVECPVETLAELGEKLRPHLAKVRN